MFQSLPIAATSKVDMSTRASEAYDKAIDTLGGFGSFTKLGAKSSNRNQLTANADLLSADQQRERLAAAFEAEQRRVAGESNFTAAAGKVLEPEFLHSREHFVTLTDSEGQVVEFKSMPEIQEQRQVQYEAVQPPQTPGAFQKYKQTDSTTWQVNATLVSRNSLEASENLRIINRLRGWTMPYFGNDIKRWAEQKLGAPPPTLKFSGYSEAVVGPVPVVITSMNWTWPKDVDWLPAVVPYAESDILARQTDPLARQQEINDQVDAGVNVAPFPAVIQVTISLVESFSTTQFNNFNLQAYRAGDMVGAYIPYIAVQVFEDADGDEEAQVIARSGSMSGRQLNVLQGAAQVRDAVTARARQQLSGSIASARSSASAPLPSINLDPRASLRLASASPPKPTILDPLGGVKLGVGSGAAGPTSGLGFNTNVKLGGPGGGG